jgi:hypothetical protein
MMSTIFGQFGQENKDEEMKLWGKRPVHRVKLLWHRFGGRRVDDGGAAGALEPAAQQIVPTKSQSPTDRQ